MSQRRADVLDSAQVGMRVMGDSGNQCDNTYRLVAIPRGEEAEQFIEFRAPDTDCVFRLAERLFVNQDMEVYSNGRALCRLFIAADGGYWVINPPRVAKAPARPSEQAGMRAWAWSGLAKPEP